MRYGKPAAAALGALLALSTPATAQDDTLRLGGTKSMFTTSPTADTMTLGGQGTMESAREEYTELTRGGGFRGGVRVGWGGRGGWGGARVGWGGARVGWGGARWGGGVRVGWGGGWGGVRVGWGGARVGWGGWGVAHRPWGWGGGWGGTVVVGGGFPVAPSYYGGSFCGISADSYDLSTPTMPLGAPVQVASAPVIRVPYSLLHPTPSTSAQPILPPPIGGSDRTFPYDGGPAKPIPQPLEQPQGVPEPIPPADDLRVVFKNDTKRQYVFKAYGEK